MACFLIDFENESGKLLDGISCLNLTEKDELVIFYSKNVSHVHMELHKELEKVRAKKLYIKTEVGTPHALDFQLSSYLGACIQKHPEKEYFIVSKDKGFDCVCRFWNSKNIFVERIAVILLLGMYR
ncbi:MAG: PIN domain-containing protein [Clostridium sp.]|nr:PIN domain-containing protein [Clostridium sp.]